MFGWCSARFSPSRGYYASLTEKDSFMLRSRRFSRMLIVTVLLVAACLFVRPVFPSETARIHFVKSSFDWSTYTYRHPRVKNHTLPIAKPLRLPPIQYRFPSESKADARQRILRQDAILKTFSRCWRSYKIYAWGKDELQPISAQSKNTFGGWAATLVDSLDTLWIMGLDEEFYEAVGAAASIDWANTSDTACNMFETNIRHLGGLLAAYDLSQEPALLAKAVELGDMLYAGFDTPNHMPPFWLDFEKAKVGELAAEDHQISAAVGSFSLEFTRLSQITGDPKYYDAIAHVNTVFAEHQDATALPGMWPTHVNARDGTFVETSFTLGALADSLYEYLPKMYYLLGGLDQTYKKAYEDSMSTAIEHLLFRPMLPDQADILVAGSAMVEQGNVKLISQGQHLSCFTGGMFALGGRLFSLPEHVDIGSKLTDGCIYSYDAFPPGLMPEIFEMRPYPSYLLRPEALESVFVLYRITGNKELQEAAWRMFLAIQAATETEYANAAIDNVTAADKPSQRDSMESFWFAETLKYLYLIFSEPTLISLDEYILNTEAHPLRRPK